jgi:hypothetical protein
MNVMVCNIYSTDTNILAGAVFSPEVFRQIVRRGYGSSREALRYAIMIGATKEQYLREWKSNLVEQSMTL